MSGEKNKKRKVLSKRKKGSHSSTKSKPTESDRIRKQKCSFVHFQKKEPKSETFFSKHKIIMVDAVALSAIIVSIIGAVGSFIVGLHIRKCNFCFCCQSDCTKKTPPTTPVEQETTAI